MGYLPRELLFNAFQLGAEKERTSSIIKWRSINIIICSNNRVKNYLTRIAWSTWAFKNSKLSSANKRWEILRACLQILVGSIPLAHTSWCSKVDKPCILNKKKLKRCKGITLSEAPRGRKWFQEGSIKFNLISHLCDAWLNPVNQPLREPQPLHHFP
jgi:hypothetical protein